MHRTNLWLRLILGAICTYHILLGILPFLSDDLAAMVVRTIFGMHLEVTSQVSYLAKLLGIYAIAFGALMAVAAHNPERHTAIIWVGVLTYLARILNRIIFHGTVVEAFNVPISYMWMEIVLLLFFGGALFILRPHSSNTASS